MKNPFEPSFGSRPPLLVGREDLLEIFEEGLDDGPGAPARATIYVGGRGTGKTAMLNAVQDRARAHGWLVIEETATTGFVKRIVEQHLPTLLAERDPKAKKRRFEGFTVPVVGGGVDWSTSSQHIPEQGLRNQLALLTSELASDQAGLLIALDELHRLRSGDLQHFAAEIQHAFRNELELAFVGAGLPSAVSSLLNDWSYASASSLYTRAKSRV